MNLEGNISATFFKVEFLGKSVKWTYTQVTV
jgi:hypothetical protein